MNNASETVLSQAQTGELVSWAERIIQQTQFELLDVLTPRSIDAATEKIQAGDVICLFQVTELVFNRSEGSQERFSTVLNSLHACGASCLMLLQCHNGRSELYLGAVNKRRYDNVYFLNTIREAMRIGIEGNLPGTELKEIVSRQEIQEKLRECVDNGFDSQCVTAISCVASDQKESGPAPHGIERLLEAIGRRNFTLMVLADPVDTENMKKVRRGYEALASQLSALEQSSLSVQSGVSLTESTSYSESVSNSWSENISMTQSHTSGTGWSSAKDDKATRNKRLTGAAVGLLSGNYIAMSAVSAVLGMNQQTRSAHEDDSFSSQYSESSGTQTTLQKGGGEARATSESATIGCSTTDYHIKNLRERVAWYLQWLNRRENLGMFNCCAYVISSSASMNLMVASQYQALMQGEGEMNQPITINTWSEGAGVEEIRQSLLHLTHPAFRYKDMSENFTPAVLQSSKELARQMALPQRSVVGITVMEYAPFGREVVRKTVLHSGRVIRLGSVSHMGKASPDQPVLLDLQSLAAHTFVAGTNGSGKSNTVFRMLEGLKEAGIPFLVIEPAKGEYKNVFGHDPDVRVLGTNPQRSELLRMNPFWFNEDVNVLEHIERLLSVFNASWPMYAAMPAVLKAAMESAYRACGWDLKRSACRGAVRLFPTVQDVLEQFNGKMESTAFSQEVKGNYVGALSTRMESLCNGIYGEIFGGANITDETLFDSNVIIDLSRVGSVETKAMLMGVLLIRLEEYRMRSEAMNALLRHVTVLEEAHHLLRRTSAAQSDEGANILGKSVEMIATAIAEMRSYGEGFMIVDQSPGLLDISVMRNTNTKVILRLPEGGDRDIVGATMGLTPEQVFEISRFKTGLCAVYQQNWLEAVLCQVDRAGHEAKVYTRPAQTDEETLRRARIVRALVTPFLGAPHEPAPDQKELMACIEACGLPGAAKRRLLSRAEQGIRGASWHEIRALAVLAAGEMPAPLPPVTAESVEAWRQEQMNDPDMIALWGADCLPLLIKAKAQVLAEQAEEWAQALTRLPILQSSADDRLKKSRGLAAAWICPLNTRPKELDAESLEAAFTALTAEGAADQALVGLLRHALDTGAMREKGVIQPYADVVWTLLGGRQRWDALFERIRLNDIAGWDEAARVCLREAMDTDRNTETSVLSLFLQKKGALPEVRRFFPRWMNYARRQRAEQ